MKKLLAMLAFSGTMMLMSACNTIHGVGQDADAVADCADGVEGNC